MASSAPRPVALIILDGYGHNPDSAHNAVAAAHTPNMDALWAKRPHAFVHTDGRHVGLPDGQMGNSEVGHMNLGAGRIVYQDFTRITKAIEDHANELLRAGLRGVRREPYATAIRAVGRHDFLGTYVDDLPAVLDLDAWTRDATTAAIVYRLAYAQGGLYLQAFVPDYSEIRTFAAERLAGYQTPERLEVVAHKTYWDAKNVKLKSVKFLPIEDNKTAYNMFKNGDFSQGPSEWSTHPQAVAKVRVEKGDDGANVWHVTWHSGNWSTIYQEQVLLVARAVAGFDLAEADSLRRAMTRGRSREEMIFDKEKLLSVLNLNPSIMLR